MCLRLYPFIVSAATSFMREPQKAGGRCRLQRAEPHCGLIAGPERDDLHFRVLGEKFEQLGTRGGAPGADMCHEGRIKLPLHPRDVGPHLSHATRYFRQSHFLRVVQQDDDVHGRNAPLVRPVEVPVHDPGVLTQSFLKLPVKLLSADVRPVTPPEHVVQVVPPATRSALPTLVRACSSHSPSTSRPRPCYRAP